MPQATNTQTRPLWGDVGHWEVEDKAAGRRLVWRRA